MNTQSGVNIWMQLLGFERNDPDRGAARFLERTGFVPDAVCALIFHPDFVHLHRGMDEEYELFPDNCAYYAVPRNAERERQPWTNYDLRILVRELKKHGVSFYAGIMGSYLGNMFHKEWLSDYPELRTAERSQTGYLHCLKRFRDGTYYEDFFAKKLAETLRDYGMAGVHLADSFCPTTHCFRGDFSADMLKQFEEYRGKPLPEALEKTLFDDSFDANAFRGEYIYAKLREEWLRFYAWRWERFFRTVSKPVHEQGREIWMLGMYCTDPFETRYIYGFDTAAVMRAGADCITANTLPTSVALNIPGREYYFHRYHMDTPFLRAQIGSGHMLNMAGVQDASEEWSVLEHRPVLLERDIYTEASFVAPGKDGFRRATDGYFLCLGDGLERQSWDFLKKRMDIALDVKVSKPWSPVILWSDAAQDRLLGEYIRTRRTSPHKQSYEVWKAGTPFAGCIRTGEMTGFDGVMFVPNFDLLSDEEQRKVLSSTAAVVATVPAGKVPEEISRANVRTDRFSDYPMSVFTSGFTVPASVYDTIENLCSEDDGKPQMEGRPSDDVYPLRAELPFRKLTKGFVSAVAALLKAAMLKDFPVTADVPMLAVRLEDGNDRLWLYNTDDDHYGHAVVDCGADVKEVRVASAYPVQPVRFLEERNTGFAFRYDGNGPKQRFQTKLAPGGVTITDIRRFEPAER